MTDPLSHTAAFGCMQFGGRADEAASRAMFDAMRPYFEEDGIALTWEAPDRWLAQGEVFLDLPCASLDRVVGRLVDDWLPRRSATGTLQRLQQEMQMLLYTHPANAEREQAGLKPVNSFWVSGAGALPPHFLVGQRHVARQFSLGHRLHDERPLDVRPQVGHRHVLLLQE